MLSPTGVLDGLFAMHAVRNQDCGVAHVLLFGSGCSLHVLCCMYCNAPCYYCHFNVGKLGKCDVKLDRKSWKSQHKCIFYCVKSNVKLIYIDVINIKFLINLFVN